MKTKLQLLAIFMLTICMVHAQETTVNTTLGVGYSNQVFYKLSTETEISFARDSWDLAFLRTSAMSMAIRVNDGFGIQVFEASNNISDWATIDITNESNWTELHNSETTWDIGAFDNASNNTAPFGYGWGQYNMANHHVVGTIIFVLKYADGTYKKLIIEDFYGGYTIKYANWNTETTTWDTDQTATIANLNNPNNKFNYYSLQNNNEVVAEPATTDWDLKFTKYYTDYYGDASLYYNVTGVLINEDLEIAVNDEPSGMPANPSLTYSSDINTIGHDWKTYGSSGYTTDSNKAFYIKYADDTVYRLYFTSFSGSTGDLSFKFEDVTATLSLDDVSEAVSFGIFPNPSTDKKINLIYDVNKLNLNKNQVIIYTTAGQKVFESSLKNTGGFYNKTLDLSALKSGVYILKLLSGETSVTKKLILK